MLTESIKSHSCEYYSGLWTSLPLFLLQIKLSNQSSNLLRNSQWLALQGGELSLDACDVTSSTGTGMSSEGGSLSVINTSIHDCAANGVALYADLEGVGSEAIVQNSQISRNSLNGVLVREGSHLVLKASKIDGNNGAGLAIKVQFGVLRLKLPQSANSSYT